MNKENQLWFELKDGFSISFVCLIIYNTDDAHTAQDKVCGPFANFFCSLTNSKSQRVEAIYEITPFRSIIFPNLDRIHDLMHRYVDEDKIDTRQDSKLKHIVGQSLDVRYTGSFLA